MTASNGKTVFVGFDAISVMLAGIKPSEFIIPEAHPEPRHHVVGQATDAIKRLATLREQMEEAVRPLREEQDMLQKRAKRMLSGITSLSQVASITSSDEFATVAKRLDEIPGEASEPIAVHDIAENLLWFEIKKTFPGLVGKPAIGFDSKWQVYWTESEPRHGDIGDLISALKRGGAGFDVRMM